MEPQKETEIILNEIRKTQRLYDEMDKYIIIKINDEIETQNRSFEFKGMFNDSTETIEATHSLTTLNLVLKALLNGGFIVNFEYEKF